MKERFLSRELMLIFSRLEEDWLVQSPLYASMEGTPIKVACKVLEVD